MERYLKSHFDYIIFGLIMIVLLAICFIFFVKNINYTNIGDLNIKKEYESLEISKMTEKQLILKDNVFTCPKELEVSNNLKEKINTYFSVHTDLIILSENIENKEWLIHNSIKNENIENIKEYIKNCIFKYNEKFNK